MQQSHKVASINYVLSILKMLEDSRLELQFGNTQSQDYVCRLQDADIYSLGPTLWTVLRGLERRA